jgi:hypothetical protein
MHAPMHAHAHAPMHAPHAPMHVPMHALPPCMHMRNTHARETPRWPARMHAAAAIFIAHRRGGGAGGGLKGRGSGGCGSSLRQDLSPEILVSLCGCGMRQGAIELRGGRERVPPLVVWWWAPCRELPSSRRKQARSTPVATARATSQHPLHPSCHRPSKSTPVLSGAGCFLSIFLPAIASLVRGLLLIAILPYQSLMAAWRGLE